MDKPCECAEDGMCRRYGRHMAGRFREICQGINVDAGTAVAFRDLWEREAHTNTSAAPVSALGTEHITLKTDQMPGDAVAMTAAIYSLHQAYPGRYLTAVDSNHPEVFAHNPDVSPLTPNSRLITMHYPAIHRSNERGIHFMQAWCEHLGAALGLSIPLMTDRPHLYFHDPAPPIGKFWVVCSGGKKDFTAKLWGTSNYQRVVDLLHNDVHFVQVGASKEEHPQLSGVRTGVGETSLRGLFNVVRLSRGVLCGVSLLMHVAAALGKPAIVIAGGREPVAWNAYPRQQYVHTVGALPCKSTQGHVGQACWRSRTVPLGDGLPYDDNPCLYPSDGSPLCMQMIHPEEVAALISRYNAVYREGTEKHVYAADRTE